MNLIDKESNQEDEKPKNILEYDTGKFINLDEVGNRHYHYNYTNYGFNEAGRHSGSVTSFRLFLPKLYSGYTEYARKNQNEFQQDKNDVESKIGTLKIKNENMENKIKEIDTNKIFEIEEKIKNFKQDIHETRQNPEKLNSQKTNKLGYYIGIVILSCLSVYLWIFYSSAIYSAFFREINFTKNVIFNSIFYANSITEAYSGGATSLIFTLFSPIIFLALGYLIYKFVEEKKYLKMVAIVLLTFIFDCIIAYEISNKIYDAKALNSFSNMPPYELKNAVTDINVWAIIFLGFLVYIIWGIVLSFVMEEHGKMNIVESNINKLKNQIKDLEDERLKFKDKISEFKNEIGENNIDINKLENSLKSFFFNLREFNKIVYEFSVGWIKFLENGQFPKERCEQISGLTNGFISNLKNDFPEFPTTVQA